MNRQERRRSSRASVLHLIALGALLVGCGDDPRPTPPTPPVTPPPVTPPQGTGGGAGTIGAGGGPIGGAGGGATTGGGATGGGTGGAVDESTKKPLVVLKADLLEPVAQRDEPILVNVQLRSQAEEPLALVEPEVWLTDRLIVQVRVGRQIRGFPLKPVRRGAKDGPARSRVLEPGEMFEVQVDVAPALRKSPVWDLKDIRFALLYMGRGKALPGGTVAWNVDGRSPLTSEWLGVEVPPPEWLGDPEDMDDPENETFGDGWNLAVRYRPDLVKERRAAIEQEAAALDQQGCLSLAAAVPSLGSNEARTARVGGAALYLIRLAGNTAFKASEALTTDPRPALQMVRAVLEEDFLERAGRQRSAGSALTRALGEGTGGSWLRVSIKGRKGVEDVAWHLTAEGVLLTERAAGGGSPTRTGVRLLPEQLEALRMAVSDARVWCLRALREAEREGEGRATIEMGSGREAPVRLDFPADEALEHNLILRGLFDHLIAFRR